MKKRSYDNSFREEQAQQTRERILEAVARLVWEGKLEDFSTAKVAERAGVSPATIYRHFANRSALLDAVDGWLQAKLERPPLPTTPEEMVEAAGELYGYYERNRDLMQMAQTTAALREVRQHGQKRRDEILRAAMSPLVDHLEPERARAVMGVVRVLHGFDAFRTITDRFDVSADEAARAVTWTFEVLAEQLKAERPAKKSKGSKTRKGRDEA